jgi:hypothetical protein
MAQSIANIRALFGQVYGVDPNQLRNDSAAVSQAAHRAGGLTPQLIGQTRFGTLGAPLVENIEDLDFSQYQLNTDLRDRLVEQNLDDATKCIQACLALRKEYQEIAKLYIDTRLKSEEFFRLDDIHQQEIAAGAYELPHSEALNEKNSVAKAVQELVAQGQIYAGLKAGALSDPSVAAYVAQSSDLAGATTNVDAATARDRAGKIAQYRAGIDIASWDFSNRTSTSNAAQLQGRLDTATAKEAYLLQDVAFRTARAAVSRELAYSQLFENVRPGSIVNYAERLFVTKKLFRDYMERLVPRVLALRTGVHALYGIDTTLNPLPVKDSVLDSVAAWLANIQDKVSIYKRRERTFVFSVWLRRALGGNIGPIARPGGASIQVSTAYTLGQSGLLRGVGFEYASSQSNPKRPITVSASVPLTVTNNLAGGNQPGPTSLTFGRVLPTINSEDLRPQHSDIVWNGSPYGTWTLNLGPDDYSAGGVDDLVMYLWLAFPS